MNVRDKVLCEIDSLEYCIAEEMISINKMKLAIENHYKDIKKAEDEIENLERIKELFYNTVKEDYYIEDLKSKVAILEREEKAIRSEKLFVEGKLLDVGNSISSLLMEITDIEINNLEEE